MISTLLLLLTTISQPAFTFNGGLTLSEGDKERGLANVFELINEKKMIVGLSERDKKAIFKFEGKSDDLFAEFEQTVGVVYQYDKQADAPVEDGSYKAFLNYRLTLKTTNAGFLRAADGKVIVKQSEKNATKSLGYFSLPISLKRRYEGYGGLAWLPLPTLRISGVGKASIEIFDLGVTKDVPKDSICLKQN